MYSEYKKPSKFDYNVVVIGAGSAGLVSTAIARAVKAKVALIEKHKMGGDCLNYGCVPSKALIHFAKQNKYLNYSEIQNRIQSIIQKIEPHDSAERFKKMGADVFQGNAVVKSPWEVEINGQILKTKSIIIATGAEPFVPPISGIENVKYLTSETLWNLTQLPKKLLIIGGGPIGCELAQAFSRLGSTVTLVERGDRLLRSESQKASQVIFESLIRDKVDMRLNSYVTKFINSNRVLLQNNNLQSELEFDHVLIAIGRKPRVDGFGLESLQVKISKHGTVDRNEFLQTNYPNIFVCGDVAGPFQLTHAAGHQAWYAAVNALFGDFKLFSEDLRVMPRCTFTNPEVASVGLTEGEKTKQLNEYDTVYFPLEDFDRAICDEETEGFIEVLTQKTSDKILGVTIVGPRAGEMLSEFTLAMRWNLGLKKILSTVHPYPTWSDANKMAALEWQRKNIPHNLLKISEKLHAWKRS